MQSFKALFRSIAALALVASSTPASIAPAHAAEATITLKWSQLVPAGAAPAKRSLFGAKPGDAASQPNIPEAGWMSLKRQQPGAGAAPTVVSELDGKRVSIGGYVVPLDFENTSIKEFLLVPFVGACIHVPPPPANQIIYVKAAQGFAVGGANDAVTVTGTMTTAAAATGLADAGYSIAADAVEIRTQ